MPSDGGIAQAFEPIGVIMKRTIQAKSLTPLQLKMLDIGAPVIVSCQTLSGETVEVRLQTQNLESVPKIKSPSRINTPTKAKHGHAKGCWETHGVYVAIMSNGAKK
jgi:hypothetical protein